MNNIIYNNGKIKFISFVMTTDIGEVINIKIRLAKFKIFHLIQLLQNKFNQCNIILNQIAFN